MSDHKYGDPVEEPRNVDDVVGSANEGLADAEAASRDAVGPEEAEQYRGDAVDESAYVDSTPADVPVADEPVAEPADVVAERPVAQDATPVVAEAAPVHHEYEISDEAYAASATTAAATPADATVAPVAPVAVAAAAPQPIFVQAPEAPLPRGNRGAAGAIGLLAALTFAILYLGATLAVHAIDGDVTTTNIGEKALAALSTWSLWVPVAVFFLSFWLLGAIINRGRWGHWVVFGLLVGVASYLGHILGALFQAPFWTLTGSEGADLVEGELLAPLAIAAFVIGRELTIWFGAWVAARGKRVTELNNAAQLEYERTLEAGPRLQQS